MGNENCDVKQICPDICFESNRRKIFSKEAIAQEQEDIQKAIEKNIR
jgi:hypothetical protein